MNSRLKAVLTVGTIVLAGCVSPAEQKAADTKQCQGYGFTPGSEAFANCMMTIANRRSDDMRHWQDEQKRRWEEQQKSQQEPAQAAPSQPAQPTAMDCTTSETSTTTGNTTNVQSRTNCHSR
ncbi:MAG: hypothetical protein U1E63_09100 [Burkholderiales bacterium]